ncbi:MAG: ATP-binding protein [Myxococcota bacterium]
MPALRSIRVQRFKRIDDAPFDLQGLNVLVGANNSGKSSVIQGIHFAIAILQTIGLEQKWPKSQQTLSTSLNPRQLIYSPSDNVYSLGLGGKLVEKAEKAIRFEFTLQDGTSCALAIRKGRNRNIVVVVDNALVAQTLSSLGNPFSIFSPGLAGVAKTETYVSDGVLLRTLARGDANLVLRNILLRLWGTEGWGSLMEDLHEVFPSLELEVSFKDATDEFISVWACVGQDWVPLELSGTGVLQATQILSYVHRFSPSLVVLDEPDSHLHPNNQRLLCSLLRRIADERGTQVLLTTHSRHVVDAVGPGSGFLWVRNGTVDRAGQDDELGVLLEIGALDIKERAANPDTKVVVLTEDRGTRALDGLLASSGFDPDKTTVLPYYGVTGLKQLRPLVEIIFAQNPKVKLVLHRDRDFLLDAEASAWEAEVRKLRVEPFLTDGVDIESHYLRPAYLAQQNDAADEAWFREVLGDIVSELRDDFIARYVNGRIHILRQAGAHRTLNHGQLAVEASKELDAKPHRYRHGKMTLQALKKRYQDEHGQNLRLYDHSPLLEVDVLATVAKKAFPEQ